MKNSKASHRSVMVTLGRFSDMRNRLADGGKSAAIGAVILFGTLQIFALVGLRINTSPSLPVGLYRATSDQAANLVEFCPANSFGALALERGYRSAGSCRDGGAPLLKPVIASRGDVVEISRTGIAVNGWAIPNTAPMSADFKGRRLAPWPSGRYAVASGEIWVASSFNARSFDSRYFGPVPVAAIHDHVRPLITFGK